MGATEPNIPVAEHLTRSVIPAEMVMHFMSSGCGNGRGSRPRTPPAAAHISHTRACRRSRFRTTGCRHLRCFPVSARHPIRLLLSHVCTYDLARWVKAAPAAVPELSPTERHTLRKYFAEGPRTSPVP